MKSSNNSPRLVRRVIRIPAIHLPMLETKARRARLPLSRFLVSSALKECRERTLG